MGQTCVATLGEFRLWKWLLAFSVDVALELASHAEVVDEQGSLIDMLKQAELSILEAQLEPVLEVLMCVDPYLFRPLLNRLRCKYSYGHLSDYPLMLVVRRHEGLLVGAELLVDLADVGSVEAVELTLAPLELIIGQF